MQIHPNAVVTVDMLKNNILFTDTTPEFLGVIASGLKYQTVDHNELIYQQGEPAKGLYLLIEGSVEIFSQQQRIRFTLSHSNSGHLFGEFLLFGNSVRTNSATALQASTLLFWPIEAFTEFLTQYSQQSLPITTRLVRRHAWNQTMQALRLCNLFNNLDETIVRQLINQLTIRPIPANSLLFKQNEESDTMCIVINGQFEVNKLDENQQPIFLGMIGRGGTVGEMGLISGASHSANVKALRDSTVAYLARDAYERLLKQYPLEINHTFVRSILSHFNKQGTSDNASCAKTIALISLSPDLDIHAFLQPLMRGLSELVPNMVLTSDIVDQAFMRPGLGQCDFTAEDNAGLVQWLSEQEAIHELIIYCADPSLSPWTRRCLRQADQVLFLAEADDSAAIKDIERAIADELICKSGEKMLVIQHQPQTLTPTGTSAWLKARQIDRYYHVKIGRQQDFDRLARFLTGRAIGLVLGGGAARGFAHIGVLKALKELNIAVDLVGGNSMGAILAAEFALQWDEHEMLEKTRHLCLQGDSLTLPMVSLFSGNVMTAALRKLFGDLHIEDLWIPFFCVSCNISRAKLMTHHQGELLSALLSSNTPPGLFPPQVSHGDLLVDGALLNNLPVDVMREFNGGGNVIAVDVNEREDLLDNTDNLGGISGWRLAWGRLNPLTPKVKMPNLVQILTRASMIGGLAQQKKMHEGLADLYLQPPVNDFPLMGYADASKIADAGYNYAIHQLSNWQANKKKS